MVFILRWKYLQAAPSGAELWNNACIIEPNFTVDDCWTAWLQTARGTSFLAGLAGWVMVWASLGSLGRTMLKVMIQEASGATVGGPHDLVYVVCLAIAPKVSRSNASPMVSHISGLGGCMLGRSPGFEVLAADGLGQPGGACGISSLAPQEMDC